MSNSVKTKGLPLKSVLSFVSVKTIGCHWESLNRFDFRHQKEIFFACTIHDADIQNTVDRKTVISYKTVIIDVSENCLNMTVNGAIIKQLTNTFYVNKESKQNNRTMRFRNGFMVDRSTLLEMCGCDVVDGTEFTPTSEIF